MIQVSGLLDRVKRPKAQGIGAAIAFALTSGLAIYGSTIPHDARQRSLFFATTTPVETSNEAVPAASAKVVDLDATGATSVVGPLAAGANNALTLDPASASLGDRTALARALQAGLARAQCYTGPVNGAWTTQSKDAMRRFTTAVNAQLPVNEPDHILLALIETNSAANCSSAPDRPARAIDAASQLARPAAAKSEVQAPVTLEPHAPLALAPAATIPAAAARETAITATPIDPPRRLVKPEARPPAPVFHAQAQRPLPSFRPKPAPFAGVAKTISKSVKSIERSLASIFN